MRFLITAGPTREPIDEVRFISNRSSGRVGIALAEAAAGAGHEVTLLLGPVLVATTLHEWVRVERFTTTADLERLLAEHFPACDALVMAAAVADYRPIGVRAGKMPRQEGAGGVGDEAGDDAGVMLRLQPTPDLVAGVAATKRPDQRVVAFALEEEATLEARAVEKMRRKQVDAIVANPLATMDSGEIAPTLLTAGGGRESPGVMAKDAFARWLVDRVAAL